MKHRQLSTAGICALVVSAACGIAAAPQNTARGAADSNAGSVAAAVNKETPLFDGKTFTGWEGDTAATFRIEDGAIVGGSLQRPVPRNEFLCTTGSYRNFILRLKFKLLGEGANACVQFRSRRIPDHHEVIGYQADMGDPSWWGSLYDESRRNRVLAAPAPEDVNRVLKRGEWNDYTIRCDGRRVDIWLNGFRTVAYTEPDAAIADSGVIGLQIHGGPPSEAWYRDITIEELP